MGRLQGKNKAKVVPNNIAVSDPNIIAGFKVKLNTQTKNEDFITSKVAQG